MKKMQEKSKIYNIHAKAPTPPQAKANHKLSLKPSHMDGKHQALNSRGWQPKFKVSQCKRPYSP
jgi:hypothetical protein